MVSYPKTLIDPVFLINCAYICTGIRSNLNVTVLYSIITWSTGKKTYKLMGSIVHVDSHNYTFSDCNGLALVGLALVFTTLSRPVQ